LAGADDDGGRGSHDTRSLIQLQPLVHDPKKWIPVFRKEHAQTRF
jgi:hypothetical protein